MGSGGGSVGGFAEGSKGKGKSKRRVQIPDWLQPFVDQSVGAAGRGLTAAETALQGDQVADLNPLQIEGLNEAANVARGGGGFIPAAQQAFLSQAQTGSTLDPTAQAALQGTAGGDFLYGGQGFDAAVNAAVQAATPQIASAFGGTAGGLSGGLARQAVGDTAVNAFASQFGQERRNQLAASQMLGNFGQEDARRQLFAAGQLPQIGTAGANILTGVGGAYQDQAQREIEGPVMAGLTLLDAALGGPGSFSSFLGDNTKTRTKSFSHGIQGSGGK